MRTAMSIIEVTLAHSEYDNSKRWLWVCMNIARNKSVIAIILKYTFPNINTLAIIIWGQFELQVTLYLKK